MLEKAAALALGFPRADSEVVGTAAGGAGGKGQQVPGGKQHGEVLAVAEIMLQVTAVVFENVEHPKSGRMAANRRRVVWALALCPRHSFLRCWLSGNFRFCIASETILLAGAGNLS